MQSQIPPMSIHVTPRAGGRYKSIQTLLWNEIPGLAIITGRNGSGKTQLLELLAYHFSGARPSGIGMGADLPVEVRVAGRGYSPEEIAFVPASGRFLGGQPVSLAGMADLRNNAMNHAQNFIQTCDINDMVRGYRLLSRLGKKERNRVVFDAKMVEGYLYSPDLVLDDIDVTASLCLVFMAHRFKILEALERGLPGLDEQGNPLGKAPWEIVNEALEVAGFPYRVIAPFETKLLDQYYFRLKDIYNKSIIDANELSSGEKVILQIVLWLFAAGVTQNYPKLLLLDEPDAHLHPAMTTQFLNVVSEVLVSRYGIRVIMTTHSPSTVALAPDGAVYQIERGEPEIKPITQRSEAISILTAGMITVSRSTKFCFVEDDTDVSFFTALTDVLMDQGPGRDPHALQPVPAIAFIPASVGVGRDKTAGGSTVVQKWVGKLDAEPIDSIFVGIIDKDSGNAASERIYVVSRYSIENYLLDPFNIFCLLLDNGIAPTIEDFKITPGTEFIIKLQKEELLQKIANAIISIIESGLPHLKNDKFMSVEYTNGSSIKLPGWIIDYRGHDLMASVQQVFRGPRFVNPPNLIKVMRRCRMIPKDLADTLHQIQRS
jgi:predicted ATPase